MASDKNQPEKKNAPPNSASTDIAAFVREKLFPDPEAIFAFSPLPLASVKDSAVFVLDACALLLPYEAGKLAMEGIRSTYTTLARENRLIVPHQASREFAARRLAKIQELYDQSQRLRDGLQPLKQHTSPALDVLDEYAGYKNAREEANQKINDCRRALEAVESRLVDWYHDDPVNAIYRELFKAEVLVGPKKTTEELNKDNEHRNRYGIPPGSSKKDASKPDAGIGDKIIWHTILGVAAERKCHVVFVTQDVKKGDWVHYHKGSSERVLFPRYELTEEFRRESDGKTLHIVELSGLLELFDADDEVVQSVQNVQGRSDATFEVSPAVLERISRLLRRSRHSFDFLRDRGIRLSDFQFMQLIQSHPDRFKFARVRRHDESGKRIGSIPGMTLIKK